MEEVWRCTAIILFIMLSISLIYHMYYHKNIKYITGQLEEIISTADTNQILTVAAKQKDIVDMVNMINKLVNDNRLSGIQMKRMNDRFRQSIINISHDLRTPLTTASGYVQMLQTNITEEERQLYISIILERQNMVKLLLEQLFEYVRIESGEITYEKAPLDVKKVFLDTLIMYYDDFNKKGQEPVIRLPEKPCMVLGDEQGVKRVFANILFNAVVHGEGDYCFEIKEREDSYLFISSNISEPMTRDDLENIFERFYTKDQSRNKKTTGLGLSIAREITKRLGGAIEAYYNNGRLSISVSFAKVKEKSY